MEGEKKWSKGSTTYSHFNLRIFLLRIIIKIIHQRFVKLFWLNNFSSTRTVSVILQNKVYGFPIEEILTELETLISSPVGTKISKYHRNGIYPQSFIVSFYRTKLYVFFTLPINNCQNYRIQFLAVI